MSIFGQFLLNADQTWDDTGVSKYDPEADNYPSPKMTAPANGSTITTETFTQEVSNGGNVLVKFAYHFRDTPFPTGGYVAPVYTVTDTLAQSADFAIPNGWESLYVRVYYSRADGVMGTGAEQFSEGRYIDAVFILDIPVVGSLSIISPASGYIATSPDVYFEWEDMSKPNAVYDLHVYKDAARTQKVIGTDGLVFDTNSIGTATSHTFYNDISDGNTRYGLLWQWPDATYTLEDRVEILFEYTAFRKEVISGGPDYDFVKGLTDIEFNWLKGQYTSTPMDGTEGYFSAAGLWGSAMAYKATDDTFYLTEGIRIGQNWIDSGADIDGDGYLDWWDYHKAISGPVYNYDHHEYRAASGVADVLVEMIRSSYDGGKSGRRAEWAEFLRKHVWEKWDGRDLSDGNIPHGSRASQAIDYVGRWTLIALALDKAQAAGLITSSTQYRTWIESTTDNLGKYMSNYLNKYGGSTYKVEYWVGGGGSTSQMDTEHWSDLVYPILRCLEQGYNVGGRGSEFIPFFKGHLDTVVFPNSYGFYQFPIEGARGNQNDWAKSSHRGIAMGAAFGSPYQERWVDLVRNHKPAWTFFDETGHNRLSALAFGGALMWALNGGTL